MKSFCIYTSSIPKSKAGAERAVSTGKKFGVAVEMIESVNPSNLRSIVQQLGLKLKYEPTRSMTTDFKNMKAPEGRICNGVTHYKLYQQCIKLDKPIMILEHDAYFVGQPPDGIYEGVIQISSHNTYQMSAFKMKTCTRANKMFKFQPDYHYDDHWDKNTGVFKHPLTGMNGTSGYIIGPGAAKTMVEYLQSDGVGFADRVRTQHIGENNLYIQYPFSVFCSQKL